MWIHAESCFNVSYQLFLLRVLSVLATGLLVGQQSLKYFSCYLVLSANQFFVMSPIPRICNSVVMSCHKGQGLTKLGLIQDKSMLCSNWVLTRSQILYFSKTKKCWFHQINQLRLNKGVCLG